jgi:outer membrane protein assembly factor BamB
MAIGKRLAAFVIAGAATLACSVSFGDVPKDAAKDWPQFHGTAQDNISHETGLLKQWPQGGPPLAWKATGIGEGHSSVSVSNGKIFTAGAEGSAGSGGSTFVYALNEADGKVLWKAKLGENWKNDQGGFGSRGTPTVDGDMVYMIDPVGDVACFNTADGKEIWHSNLKRDFGGGPPQWGYSESATIDGDHVICTPGGRGGAVVALDKHTGKEVWRSKQFQDKAAYAPPLIAEIGGVRQIVSFTEDHLAGISSKDGSVLWVAPRPGKTAVIPTPVIKDNYIYVTSGYGVGCDLFKINSEGGKFSAEQIYQNKVMVNHHGGVILFDGFIYGFSDSSKSWICQDMMSGNEKWKNEGVGKGSIAYADGHFYLRSEGKKGTIALIDASSDGYKEHGRFDQPQRSGKQAWPHLVIANGKLYVRDMNLLLCYDIKAK